jgi:tRNA(fMet)-specific endonuclease VapC
MWYGIGKSGRRRANEAAPATFLTLNVTPWSFEPEDAEHAGDIRAGPERGGTPIGTYDIMITAQARRRGALPITANIAEFNLVPGLRMDNWNVA